MGFARHLVVGVSQTLRRWTEGATYVRQGDHQIGHWPIFLVDLFIANDSSNCTVMVFIGSTARTVTKESRAALHWRIGKRGQPRHCPYGSPEGSKSRFKGRIERERDGVNQQELMMWSARDKLSDEKKDWDETDGLNTIWVHYRDNVIHIEISDPPSVTRMRHNRRQHVNQF